MAVAPYDVTSMQTGVYRGECLFVHPNGEMCGWYEDTLSYEEASFAVRDHMNRVHNRSRAWVTKPETRDERYARVPQGQSGFCEFCGSAFVVRGIGQRYCTDNCRKKADRRRRSRSNRR